MVSVSSHYNLLTPPSLPHHSVFPTMPRHNYVHVAPLLRELCGKYGVQYQVKGLLEAMSDIIGYDCGLLYIHTNSIHTLRFQCFCKHFHTYSFIG